MNHLPQGPRLRFRPITVDDGYTVARWRNSDAARGVFFSDDLVTPDSHAEFVRNRKPDDLIWIVERDEDGAPVGMLSLTIDRSGRSAEYGRAFLDPTYRGLGYAEEMEATLLNFAFYTLRLDRVWGEVLANNEPIRRLHAKIGWRETVSAVRDDGRATIFVEYHRDEWLAKARGETFTRTVHVTEGIMPSPWGFR